MRIIRMLKVNKYVYMTGAPSLYNGEVNYTINIIPRRIKVSYGEHTLELKEGPWWLKIINALPLLDMVTRTTFKCYVDGVYAGKARKTFFRPEFKLEINGENFEISCHSGNYTSLMQGERQIALYKKTTVTIKEANTYDVKFEESEKWGPEWIFLFGVLIDAAFNTIIRAQWSYMRWEKDIVLFDKKKDRINWK